MQSHICHVRTAYRRLPLGGKLSRKRLMRGDNSVLAKGIHSPYAPRSQIKRDSRTFLPPRTSRHTKTSLCGNRSPKAKKVFTLSAAVAVQGSSGRVREVWRVGRTPFKGSPCASKVFPLSSHNRKSTPPRQNAATGCGLNPHGSTRCFHSFVFGCRRRAVLRRTVSEPSSVAARSLVIR